MTPRQLKYFVEIVESGSLSNASQSLGIAQPALSQHIAAMEDFLGVKLFERHARGMKTTIEGARLYARALSILNQIDQLHDDVHDSGTAPRGEVRLGIAGALAAVLVTPLLRSIESEYPDIRLHLVEGLSKQITALIESRAVDLAIFPGSSEMDDMEILPVFTEHLYLFGATHSMQGQTGPIPFAKIGDRPLVAPDRAHDLRKMIEREASAQGVRLNVRYELNSVSMVTAIIKEGLGFGILPRSAFPERLKPTPVKARLITKPGLFRVQSMVWPSDRALTPAAKAVRDIVINIIKTMEADGRL